MAGYSSTVGAVAVKVRPDTDGFRGEAKRGIDRQLAGLDPKVKINADVDDARARRQLDDLKDQARDLREAIRLHVDVDDSDAKEKLKLQEAQLKDLGDAWSKLARDQANAQRKLNGNQNGINRNADAVDKATQAVKDQKAALSELNKEYSKLSRRKKLSDDEATYFKDLKAQVADAKKSLKDLEKAKAEADTKLKASKSKKLDYTRELEEARLAATRAKAALDDLNKAHAALGKREVQIKVDTRNLKKARQDLARFEEDISRGVTPTITVNDYAVEGSKNNAILRNEAEQAAAEWDKANQPIFNRYMKSAEEIEKISKRINTLWDEGGHDAEINALIDRKAQYQSTIDAIESENSGVRELYENRQKLTEAERRAVNGTKQLRNNMQLLNKETKAKGLDDFTQRLKAMSDVDLEDKINSISDAMSDLNEVKREYADTYDTLSKAEHKSYAQQLSDLKAYTRDYQRYLDEQVSRQRHAAAEAEKAHLFGARDAEADAKEYSRVLNTRVKSALEELRRKIELQRLDQINMDPTLDEGHYRQVMDRVADLQREAEAKADQDRINRMERTSAPEIQKILRKSIVSGMDEGLQKVVNDAEQTLAKMKTARLRLSPALDQAALQDEMRHLENEQLKVNQRLAEDRVRRIQNMDAPAIRKMYEEVNRLSVFGGDDDQARLKQLQAKLAKLEISPEVDDGFLKEIKLEADRAQHELNGLKADIDVDLENMFGVATRLDWATRPRTVNIFAKVNMTSFAVAEGMIKSLAGINVASKLGTQFQNLLTNLDMVSLKAVGLVTALGNIGAAGFSAAGSLSAMLGSVAQLSGLALMAPTGIAAAASSIYVLKTAWSDFFTSMERDTKWGQAAYKNLVPGAKKVADAWLEATDGMKKGIQTDFWKNASDGVTQFVNHAIPEFRNGLQDFAGEWGNFFDGVGKSFSKIALSGDLKTMWANLGKMMRETAKGAEPLVDAFNTLGLEGSKYLPKLGTYFKDNMEKFDAWVQRSSDSGKITEWIDNAITAFGQLKDSVKSAWSILESLYTAANSAGFGGLEQMQKTLANVAKTMSGAAFQRGMTNLFKGGKAGFDHLIDGAAEFGRAIGDVSDNLADVLDMSGQIGKGLLTGLSGTVRNPILQSGLLDTLTSVRDMVDDLKPSFDGLGTLLGSTLKVAGGTAKGLAPLLNTIVGAAADMATSLADGMAAAAPIITGGFTRAVQGLAGVLEPIAEIVGNVLEMFSQMPAGVQNVVLGMVGLLTMARHIGGAFQTAGGKITDAFVKSNAFREASNELTNLRGKVDALGQPIRASAGATIWYQMKKGAQEAREAVERARQATERLATGRVAGGARMGIYQGLITGARDAEQSVGRVKTAIGKLGTGLKVGGLSAVKGVFSGLKSAAGGLLGALGGPWGLAIAAAATAITLFAQKQQEAKQRVQDLTSTILDQGQAAAANKVLSDYSDTLTRMRDLGFKGQSSVIQDMIGKGSGQAVKDLQQIADLAAKLKNNPGAGSFLTEADKALLDKYNLSTKELSGNADSWRSVATKAKEATDESSRAMAAAEDIQNALADGSKNAATGMQNATDALSGFTDETADAESKTNALKRAMDALNGGKLSIDDAASASYESLDNVKSVLEDIAGKAKTVKLSSVWEGADKGFNLASESGRKLHDALSQSVSDAQQYAATMVENGKSAGSATKELEGQRSAWIKNADAMGINADVAGDMWDRLAQLSSKDFVATVSMKTEGKTPEQIAADLQTIQSMKANVAIAVDDSELASKLVDARGDYDSFKAIFEKELNLDINSADGQAKLSEITDQIMSIAKLNPQILIGADTRIFGERRAEVDAVLTKWMSENTQVVLGMDLSQFENASQSVKDTLASIVKGGGDTGFQVAIGMDTSIFGSKKSEIDAWIVQMATKNVDLLVGMDASAFENTSATVLKKLLEIDGLDPQVKVAIETALANQKIEETKAKAKDLDNTKGTAKADVDNSQAKGKVDQTKGDVEGLNSVKGTAKADVDVTDATSAVDSLVQGTLAVFGQTTETKKVTVQADDQATPVIQNAQAALQGMPSSKSIAITATSNLAGVVAGAAAMLAAIPAKKGVAITATSNLAGVAVGAAALLAAIPSRKNVAITATSNVIAMAAVSIGALAAIKSKSIKITGTSQVPGLAVASIAALAAVRDKKVAITATTTVPLIAAAAIGMIAAVRGKTVSVGASVFGTGAVYGLRSAIAGLRSKTVTVTTKTRSVAQADGGILYGMAQAFASGGFSNPKIESPGTAAIYSALSRARLFAEPETGGEAYIPLAASKRARSTEIWKETGKRLGVYADGGVTGGLVSTTSNGPSFNITNHYPQAEPTSVTIAKAGRYAGIPAFLAD